MSLSEVLLSYDSAYGEEGIRTLNRNNELYFSLFDVVSAIQRENRILNPEKNSFSILKLMRAHITHLLPKEIFTKEDLPENIDDPIRESYVTKAGLLRVVLQDNSPACLKFQDWVLNEVLPSVLETGKYKHPSPNSLPTEGEFDVEYFLRLALQETIERKKADEILEKKIDKLEKVVNPEEMLFIDEFSEIKTMSPEKQYHFFSECLKLCSTEAHFYKAKKINSKGDIHSKMFSRSTIEKAISMTFNRSM